MGRRPKLAALGPSADFARKIEILEQEMATQRAALDRLKQIGGQRSSERDGDQPSKPRDS
jgi:hypothetical protein